MKIRKSNINFSFYFFLRECIICLSERRTILLQPCKHLVLCEGCSKEFTLHLFMNTSKCPLCREKIHSLEKVYI